MLDSVKENILANALRKEFPKGPIVKPTGTYITDTNYLVRTTIRWLEDVLAKSGSPIRLKVETAKSSAVLRGLIIFTGSETFVVPMKIGPSLVYLRKKPTYVGHPEGAPMLLRAILDEIASVMGSKDAA